MKGFKFKFDTVLNVRKIREEEALRVFADSQRAYQAEIQKKEQLMKDLQASLIRRENLGAHAVGIEGYRTEQDFIVGTKQKIIWATQKIFRASKNVEKALRAYLVAKRRTRAIELLKEKAVLEHRQEQTKAEQRELDDLMVMRTRLKEEDA